eukprot:gene31422-6596_t
MEFGGPQECACGGQKRPRYAGYVSAKLPPPPKTDLCHALAMINSMESLEILGKLLYNAAINPKEEKFRRIKMSNPKINEKIVSVPGCIETLQLMGWQQQSDEEEGGDEFLAIAPGKYISMKDVRLIDGAKERVKKQEEQAAKDRLRAASAVKSRSSLGLLLSRSRHRYAIFVKDELRAAVLVKNKLRAAAAVKVKA